MALTTNNNQPETLPPATTKYTRGSHETTTDYFHTPFILFMLIASKTIIDPILHNNYPFATLSICLFVLRFVLRFSLQKLLTARKHTGWLRFNVMVSLDYWVMATFFLSMYVAIIGHVDPVVQESGMMNVFYSFMNGLIFCGWIMISLFLVYDLVECWRISRNGEDGDEQKRAAGNVDKISEKML